ncbi:flagellar basal-body MS-ring/collar protein FliF [Catenovulum sp. 2E275]|uniref:flagellar basal-body MS-ring/collar protein FliF n=1 Tax=Catenovulum sp. 2E275 TaxID=2980497 RepID=UPI0021CF0B7C|nr:flagellar basal-body MS-ring/collar protein FliF [Catenovulum sp. 2E275]MCU4674718.1 flagellar basal-body MS-ring/collar protein FliF [Catenovulum sp. 2E275]
MANEEQKSGFLSSLSSVDVLRQVTLILALAICLAIAIFIIVWASEPDYRPLGKMQTEELIQTLDFLDQEKIDYRLEGDVIYVIEEEYQDIKLKLKRSGLAVNAEPSAGADILLTDMGFGVSQRVETERLKYSREQTLARTIEELHSIQRAKVLLAIPKENVFARHEKKPSATVVLTLKRGAILSSEEIDSVVDMVASAVQNLEPNRVTVTDQNGRLLNSGSQNDLSARSRKEYEIEQKRETEYLEKIDTILIPVVGLGNYTAQVDVTMDFTSVEQTQKSYNPDLPAVRSEMTLETNSLGGIAAGIPGALTNQPPLESNIPEEATNGEANAAPSKSHREATRNYELDTTISHTRQQTGVIRRLSVSVAVDYTATTNAETGEVTYEPRPVAELANIRRLLQGGIGFDVQRGDTLEVVAMPFVREDIGEIAETPIFEQPWFAKLIRLVLGAAIIIVLIIAVVRPMLRKLIYPEEVVDDYSEDTLSSGVDLGDETLDMLSNDFDASAVGFSSDGTLMLPDLHKDEDILKAVRALVANEPILSAQVVKAWLNEDA